jgi:phosphomevalonate kinase
MAALIASVSAPGKLVLMGDYSVVDRGRALVAAVDRRARGQWVDAVKTPPTALVQAVLRRAGKADRALEIDTSGFFDPNGRKLGLGSSAAASVVAAGLAAGDLGAPALDLALASHREAGGPLGSGVDVAASHRGGVIAASRQPGAIEALATEFTALSLFVFDTGESASTHDLVARAVSSPDWAGHAAALASIADRAIEAWRGQDGPAFLALVRTSASELSALGRSAEVPIVTPAVASLILAAELEGGAAKPSGAGGGDVAIAFGTDPGFGARVAARSGLRLIGGLAIDPIGLSAEGAAAAG